MSSPPSPMNSSKPPVAEEHVVAVDAVASEDLVEIVARGAGESPALEPVVALVAEDAFGTRVGVDEIVTSRRRTLHRASSVPRMMKSWPSPPSTRSSAWSGMDGVIAIPALDVVIATYVRDDIVPGSAIDDVVAEPAL